jgi:hypothetical protein
MKKPKTKSPTELAAEQILHFAQSLRSKLKRTSVTDEAALLAELDRVRSRIEAIIARIERTKSG